MKRTAAWTLAALLALAAPAAAVESVAPEAVISNQDRMEYAPRLAYNTLRDEYVAVWHDTGNGGGSPRRILARRLDRNGRAKGPAVVVSPTGDNRDRANPAIAYDDSLDRYFVVYMYDFDGSGGDWDVYGRFLPWNLQNGGGELTLGVSTFHEYTPRVAYSYGTSNFLVVWTRLGSPSSVNGALVSASGAVTNIAIASHASQNRLDPDVAHQPTGNNFLVAYGSGVDVFSRTVSAGGALGAETAVAAWPDTEGSPAVASCRNYQYVVAWASAVGGGPNDVFVRFLHGDGAIASAPILILGTSGHEQHPAIACLRNDEQYLVVFEQQYAGGAFGTSGRRVDQYQTLRPAFPIRPPFSGESGVTTRPTVAGGNVGWLAIWEHQRQGNGLLDIHARAVWRLFADGFEWGGTGQWTSVSP